MSLKKRLQERRIVVAPGIYDMVSMRIADAMGFETLYMTGFGVAASHLGLPDAGLASFADVESRVRLLAGGKTPLIADGDTGFGGLLNVRHAIQGYEKAGAAGIQLEDQEFPKKCGHTPGRRVISAADMVKKIDVAAETRTSRDFIIIERTDARSSLGLDEALRRAEAYLKAGADVLFIESPEGEAELRTISSAFDVPLVANMVDGGKTPIYAPKELEAMGFRIALFPVTGLLAASAALTQAYAALKGGGAKPPLMPFADFTTMIGFPDVYDFERRHADKD